MEYYRLNNDYKKINLFNVTACFLAFSLGCKEENGTASEIGKFSISLTAPRPHHY